MDTTNVNFRLDKKTKKEAEELFEDLGRAPPSAGWRPSGADELRVRRGWQTRSGAPVLPGQSR